ncbi:hypothetical protein BC832DRAFT_122963 [Gaertneriomyces semiglobifer]|nr:hypothetical protein BC832DRAFT_122963 [Gaertneriomyces semiglobifer]
MAVQTALEDGSQKASMKDVSPKIAHTAELDYAHEKLSGVVPTASKGTKQPTRSAKYIIAFNILAISLSIALWTGSSLIPHAKLHAAKGPRVSGVIFAVTSLPINVAIAFVTVFWIREMFQVEIRWFSWTTWAPVLAYGLWDVFVYAIFGLIGLFPVPFLPIYGGGLAYCVVPPLIVYMYGLPASVKSQPNFLRKFASSIVISGCLNFYWFLLFAFYFGFISVPAETGPQILVLTVVKTFTLVFTSVQIKLVHGVAKSLGHPNAEDVAALGKLLTECAFEAYIFLVIPDMHDWAVFGFWIALDIACLILELFHRYETSVDFVLHRLFPKQIHRLGSTHDLDQGIRIRIKHCLVSVVAKIFGTLIFTFLCVAFKYGPNSEWYPLLSTFPDDVIHDAMMKAWIALAVILLVAGSCLSVSHLKGRPLAKFAGQLFGRYHYLFMAIYLCAPIFPFTHMVSSSRGFGLLFVPHDINLLPFLGHTLEHS